MENRYLPPARQKPLRRGEGPILHEDTSLSVLPAYRQVSKEPLSSWGEPAGAKPRLQKPCGGQALRRRQVGGENRFECELSSALGNNLAGHVKLRGPGPLGRPYVLIRHGIC